MKKRKDTSSSRKRGGGGSLFPFTGTKVLLIEDGREDGITAKRAEMLISRIKALGGAVDLIRATRIQGNRLTIEERDKRLLHVTHVVTGLLSLGRRGVLEGLRVLPGVEGDGGEYGFKVVRPEWVTACIQQQRLVEAEEYEMPFEPSTAAAASVEDIGKKRPRTPSPPSAAKQKQQRLGAPPRRTRAEIEAILARDFPPEMDAEAREAYIAWGGPLDICTGKDMPRFACQRPTPRRQPNPHITSVLEECQDFYNAMGDRERETSFGRALGVLRAWPRRIKGSRDIKGAYHIGQSMLKEVDQILATGTSERLQALKSDPRNVGLKDLFRLHQVGSATAARWYEQGYHSVDQILAEVDAAPDGDPTQTRFYQTIKPSHEPWMGVLHFRDYSQKMSRASVAAIEAKVRDAATIVLQRRGLGPETLLLETCGGYRRGKDWNGDADVLVSCTQAEGQAGLREAVKKVLRDEMGQDLIVLKEGGAMQGFTNPNKPHEKLESHDNMLTLIKHEGLYRRLDIICPPPDQWAACVLGWSGTKQMEKDLRDYADSIGLYLTQQAVYKGANRLPNPKSPDGIFHREEDIWEFIGLKFLPPVLRWA